VKGWVSGIVNLSLAFSLGASMPALPNLAGAMIMIRWSTHIHISRTLTTDTAIEGAALSSSTIIFRSANGEILDKWRIQTD